MLTPRENFIRFFKNQPTEWIPNSMDYKQFAPEEVCENVVRGFVTQQRPFPRENYGGRGFFGIDWVFEPQAGGAISVETPIDDIEEWEEKIEWPDLDKIDWQGCYEKNKQYLKTDKMLRTTIFTGFYERLISFVGFEDAAIALVDEDQVESVHKLFDKLADTYIDFIQRMHRHFNVELIELHDDWGTQRSPMFSAQTHKEVILPYVKKVVDGAHAEGCFIEMHSCGMVEPLMPNFIEAGLDTWRGQDTAINKPALVEKYGDKFKYGVEIRPAPDATDEQVLAMVKDFKEKYSGKNVWAAFSMLMKPEKMKLITDNLLS